MIGFFPLVGLRHDDFTMRYAHFKETSNKMVKYDNHVLTFNFFYIICIWHFSFMTLKIMNLFYKLLEWSCITMLCFLEYINNTTHLWLFCDSYFATSSLNNLSSFYTISVTLKKKIKLASSIIVINGIVKKKNFV